MTVLTPSTKLEANYLYRPVLLDSACNVVALSPHTFFNFDEAKKTAEAMIGEPASARP